MDLDTSRNITQLKALKRIGLSWRFEKVTIGGPEKTINKEQEMKFLIIVTSLFVGQSVFATDRQDSKCETKVKNAAAFKIAQEQIVPVQNAQSVAIDLMSTRAAFGNSIWGEVTVRIGNRVNRAMTIKTYKVSAEEIGFSGDCEILSIE